MCKSLQANQFERPTAWRDVRFVGSIERVSESVAGLVVRIQELGPADLLAVREACSRALVVADWTPLSDERVVEAVDAVERGYRRDTAVRAQLAAEVRVRSIASRENKKTGVWLAERLRLNRSAGYALVRAAEDLAVLTDLAGEPAAPHRPATAAVVSEGVASVEQYRVIAEVMKQLPTAVAVDSDEVAHVEAALAEYTRTLAPDQLRKVGVRLLAYLNPDGDFDDVDRQRRRRLSVGPQGVDHLSGLSATLTPATRALWDVVAEVWAKPGMNNPDDPESPSGSSEYVDAAVLDEAAGRDARSTAQRNHDAFQAMLQWVVSSGDLGRHRGLPAQIIVTMTLDELESETGIATTASGGILPVRDALALAGAGRPFLALLDGRDRPLFLGRQRRLASPDQRIALIAADKGCTRPGCDQPPSRAEVHHVNEWVAGGLTDVAVMTLACGGDHSHIHDGEGGWVTQIVDTVTETGQLPDGRSARIGWTQRGTTDPLRGNTIHKPRQYVDWFRRRLRKQMIDEQFRREHPDWWAEGQRWERELDQMPDPESPDWVTCSDWVA